MNLSLLRQSIRREAAAPAPSPAPPPRRRRIAVAQPEAPAPMVRTAQTAPPRRRIEVAVPAAGDLARALVDMDTRPQPQRDEREYTHVSTLLRACARALTIQRRFPSALPVVVEPGDRIIWALGRAAEAHARQQLSAYYPEAAYGIWFCACGSSFTEGTLQQARDEGLCLRCGRDRTHYAEEVLRDDDLMVKGSVDFQLAYGEFKMTRVPVEFKSINKAGFAALEGPKPEHAQQVLYYARMLRRRGLEVPHARLIYVHKDFVWGASPYKEYTVTETPALVPVLEHMDAMARTLRTAQRVEGLPDRLTRCASASSPHARQCDVCTLCFSL